MKSKDDLAGKRFGKLIVESPIIESDIEPFAMKWKCRCDCGQMATATTLALQAGLIKSCGCTAAREVTLNLANIKRGNIEKTNTFLIQGALDGIIYENNKTGVRGVHYSNADHIYIASISFQGNSYYLGSYKTLEEAQKSREKAEKILYGGFMEHYEEDLKPQINAEIERDNINMLEHYAENLESDKERIPFFKPGQYRKGQCEVCGKPIPKGRKKYCSIACSNLALQEKSYQKHKRKEERYCSVCGKPIPTNRRKYCSDSCLGLGLKRKPAKTGVSRKQQIVCPDCGKTVWVGYSSVRCKECQAEIRKQQNKESKARQAIGLSRKIGQEASCERCGRMYIVKGATQKYCDNCAGIINKEKEQARRVSKTVPVTLTCRVCGKEFTSTAHNKPKYC